MRVPNGKSATTRTQRYGNGSYDWLKRPLSLIILCSIIWTKIKSDTTGFPFHRLSEDKSETTETYLKALETNYAGNWSEKYTSEPHLPGTNYGLVEWTESKFKEYGFKTKIDTYDIYVSYPKDQDLNLLSSNDSLLYKASLKEDELDLDPTTKGDDLIPTFLAYAANGNVTGEFVYANYGTKDDFAKLIDKGIDLSGKIAIVRYGSIFRGLKIKFAQEAGAIGVLLYSDPGDDGGLTPANGYKQYPYGPARHESSVQRGSVQFLSILPGDPTTPGYASKPGAERVDPHNSIPSIPVLPISYREVTPILAQLNGYGLEASEFGDDWIGGLPGFNYHIGPNKNVKLNLYNDQIFNITPLWNVYGEIEGTEKKDEVILIGNHRDAWIKGGAGDPNSGSAVILEIARGFNELLKTGWKPKRTIIIASWDGEEYGLLGSTEFGELKAKELQRNVVAYFNLDVAAIGSHLRIGASPLLNDLIRSTAKLLPYVKGGSLYEHFVEDANDKITNLGSGSDYTVFLEHLGIPSVDMSFTSGEGEPIYQYHSNYDSFYWMSKFADPGFLYHNLMSKFLGSMILKISEHELISFKLNDYSKDLLQYFNETVEKIPNSWYTEKVTESLKLDDQNLDFVKSATSNIYGDYLSLFPEYLSPFESCHKILSYSHNLTLGELVAKTSQELENFYKTTNNFDSYVTSLQVDHENREKLNFWERFRLHQRIKSANKKLLYFERNFLNENGLSGRSWFKHIVFASGRYTGYEGQTLPGLKEAIEDKNFDEAVYWVGTILKTIRRVSHSL